MKSYTEHIIDVCTIRNCIQCKKVDNECLYCGIGELWEPNYKKVTETAWNNYLNERNIGGKENVCKIN